MMNTIDYSDPTGVQESQIADRLRLAQLLQAQAMNANQPVYSDRAALAKVLMGALAGYQTQSAEREQRQLAEKKTAGRHAEMDAIFKAAEGGTTDVPQPVKTDDDGNPMPSAGTMTTPPASRSQLARLLARSSDPRLSDAGLGMILKGPSKIEWKDAGGELVGVDEAGNIVGHMPKGVTPDARYNKENVSAETQYTSNKVPAATIYTQDQENARQDKNLSTVPASARFTQGQENARQDKTLSTVPASTRYTQEQENARAGEKPLTETQGNAAAFGMRAAAANDIIKDLEGHGAPLGSVQSFLAKSRVTNAAAPEWAQKAEQAKLNFMSATLRKESGAVISPTEYETEDRKYFPQPGDSRAVIEQKRAARELAIDAMRVQAGPKGAQSIKSHAGGKSLFDQADAILGGK